MQTMYWIIGRVYVNNTLSIKSISVVPDPTIHHTVAARIDRYYLVASVTLASEPALQTRDLQL